MFTLATADSPSVGAPPSSPAAFSTSPIFSSCRPGWSVTGSAGSAIFPYPESKVSRNNSIWKNSAPMIHCVSILSTAIIIRWRPERRPEIISIMDVLLRAGWLLKECKVQVQKRVGREEDGLLQLLLGPQVGGVTAGLLAAVGGPGVTGWGSQWGSRYKRWSGADSGTVQYKLLLRR